MCFFIFNCVCKNFNKSKYAFKIKNIIKTYYQDMIYFGSSHSNNILSNICKEEIIIDKICFFLGLYAESMFLDVDLRDKNNPQIILAEGFEPILSTSFKFLFNNLLNYRESAGTSYQACFSLKNFLLLDTLKPYYPRIFTDFFDQIILGIKEISLYPYFDLIIEIISLKSNKKRTTNFGPIEIEAISKSCVERCLKEIKSSTQTSNSDCTILSKCINILLLITEDYCKEIENEKTCLTPRELEIILANLTNYLKNPNKINFDLEIIQIIANIQEKSQFYLDSSALIFASIEKIIKKNYITKATYDIIYLTLEKGREFLRNFRIKSDVDNDDSSLPEEENFFQMLTRICISQIEECENENTFIFSILILQKLVQV